MIFYVFCLFCPCFGLYLSYKTGLNHLSAHKIFINLSAFSLIFSCSGQDFFVEKAENCRFLCRNELKIHGNFSLDDGKVGVDWIILEKPVSLKIAVRFF